MKFGGISLYIESELFPEIFSRGGWKKLEYFWKKLEKQGRPPLKNKNSSDLGHFEIKFGGKREKLFKKKRKKDKLCSKPTIFQRNRKFYFQF